MRWKTIFLLILALVFGAVYLDTPGGIADFLTPLEPAEPFDSFEHPGTARLSLDRATLGVGDTLADVLGKFGDASETLASEYGFQWYIYPNNYKNYLQIGISEDGVVQGFYTNAPSFSFEGLSVGSSMEDVRITLGEPVDRIRKGGTTYLQSLDIDGNRERDLFLFDGLYVSIFYDLHRGSTVTSLFAVDRETELAMPGFYGTPSDALKYSFERQNYYVTNAARAREGLPPYDYNELAAAVATKHSRDMADRAYFSHETPEGKTVLDRIEAGGIQAQVAGENIACGGQNGIVMHELLWNSEGHRRNILGDYQRIGVGVWFNDEGVPYLTQNFYTPAPVTLG